MLTNSRMATLLATGLLLSSTAFGAAPVDGQTATTPRTMDAGLVEGPGNPVPPACSDGVVKDDGSVETGWGWVPSVLSGEYVQVFDRSEFSSAGVESVCICWLRTRPDDSIDFDVVFYRDDVDQPGQPEASPYAVVPAHASGVPLGIVGQFYEVDVSNVELPPGTVYIGPRWDASADQFFFVCADTTPSTPFTNVFFIDDRAKGEWANIAESNDPIFIPHRAILVRPVPRPAYAVEVPALTRWPTLLLVTVLGLVGAFVIRWMR